MFYKLMIALLIIGGLAPFTFIKGKDGQPLMSFSTIKIPEPILPNISLPNDISNSNDNGTVYKWRDSQGTWQFSSEPPAKGTDFSAKIYDSKLNVIQSVETKHSNQRNTQQIMDKQSIKNPVKNINDIGSAYNPQKIEKLFDDANNIESLLNDRMKQQKTILNNL